MTYRSLLPVSLQDRRRQNQAYKRMFVTLFISSLSFKDTNDDAATTTSRGIHDKTRSLPIPRVPTSIRKNSSLDPWTSHSTQHNRHHLNLKQALLLENGVLYVCEGVCFVFLLAAVLSNCFTFCHQLFIYLPIYLFISICLSLNVLHIPNIFVVPPVTFCVIIMYVCIAVYSVFLFFFLTSIDSS